MFITPFSTLSALCPDCRRWSLRGWLRTLQRARRDITRASRLARRERLRLGYRHVPQRVWDRRSALFIER